MTAGYLKKHIAKARTVFTKAFDLQKMMEKNFSIENEGSIEALHACAAAHRTLEYLLYLEKKMKKQENESN